jgi:type I restriction enzyme S subunit
MNAVKLDDVLKYEQPTKYIVHSENYNTDYTTPVLTAGKSFILGYTNEDEGIFEDLPVIIFDDFTTAFHYVDFPFKVKSSAMKILKPVKEKADLKYLFYKMQTISIDTALHKRYWISKYSQIQIPLPPLPQQQKIANILDAADALRQNYKALIAKYDELKQSLFLDMFGDPVSNPMGWGEKSLNELCSKITDGTHDTPLRLTEGIKFITGKHIRPFVIDYDNSDYVTEEVHNEIYRRCNPEYGDILYTNIGVNFATAAMNIVDYEFSMKNVALLKYNRGFLNGRFLESILNNEFFKDRLKRALGIGGAQQFLSLSNIKSINVLCPPIELQNQFAERVAVIEEQKAIAQKSLEKSE